MTSVSNLSREFQALEFRLADLSRQVQSFCHDQQQRRQEADRVTVTDFVEQQIRDGRVEFSQKNSVVEGLLVMPSEARGIAQRAIERLPQLFDPNALSEFSGADGYRLDPNSSKLYRSVLDYCDRYKLQRTNPEHFRKALKAVSR